MGSIVKEKRHVIGLLTRQRGDDSFVYTCTRCGLEFPSANQLEIHYEIHTQQTTLNPIEQMEVRDAEFSTQSTNQTQNHSTR